MSYFIIEWDKLIRILYRVGLAILLVSLPIFNVGMSIGMIWVASVWFLDFLNDVFYLHDPWAKFQRFSRHTWAILLTSIFALHLIGMLYTEDVGYGLHDLRVKVPLLILPFVISGFPPISKKGFDALMAWFIAAVVFSTFTCLLVYWGVVDKAFQDIREITQLFIVRISHIRLGMMAALALLYICPLIKTRKRAFLLLPLVLFLLYFLWIIESLTGFSVLLVSVTLFIVSQGLQKTNPRLKVASVITSFLLLGLVVGGVTMAYRDYHQLAREYDFEALPSHTTLGSKYDHYTENPQIENGYYVWLYVCWPELEREWNLVSDIKFDSTDAHGELIKGTVIRYLTSKGLNKDAEGIAELTAGDIKNIESGICSVDCNSKSGLRARMDEVFLEWDIYLHGGDPSGHSLTQRIEFWKAGTHTFQNNFLIGVGTGDVARAMSDSYVEIHSKLNPDFRFRSHNQYLSFAIAFGVVGLIWILFVFFYPMKKGLMRDYHFFMFYCIFLISMLTEDTLETQAGLSFFVFFVNILSVARKPESRVDEHPS